MLSDYEKEQKQRNFLLKKIKELISTERKKNRTEQEQFTDLSSFYLKLVNNNINNTEFTIKPLKKDLFEIINKNDNGFILVTYFSNSCKRKSLRIRVNGISVNEYLESDYDWLIIEPFLEHFSEFEKEFTEFSAQLDKDDKITDISQKSIETWIKALFQESPYAYCLSSSENKMTLSVKMKSGMQLDIPIYYKKFQQIMQQIMPTIVEYENFIEKNNVKVLISNLKKNYKWINNK
jgi:hypothetical protein